MGYNQLKIEDIENIYSKIYFNACELIEDAELLYKYERYARSYLAAQIAFEELGKLPMLYTVAIKLHNGIEVNWKDISSRLRNHRTKSSTSLSIVEMFEKAFIQLEDVGGLLQEGDKLIMPHDIESFKKILDNNSFTFNFLEVFKSYKEEDLGEEYLIRQSKAKYLNDYKNHSLYSDFREGEFLMPSEIIDEEKCRRRLRAVLLQQKIAEITIKNQDGLILFKYGESHFYNALKDIVDEKIEELRK